MHRVDCNTVPIIPTPGKHLIEEEQNQSGCICSDSPELFSRLPCFRTDMFYKDKCRRIFTSNERNLFLLFEKRTINIEKKRILHIVR